MKLQYVGDSFRDGLTDGKFYEGKAINMFCIALIDDSGIEKIYSRLNPGQSFRPLGNCIEENNRRFKNCV